MDINISLDRGRIAEAMKRRSNSKIVLRANQLGTAGAKQIAKWIDTELGPSTGSAERHGAVSMRALNWDYRVDNPGTLPVAVAVTCTDIDSEPTKAKFWSLNSGHRAFTQVSKTGSRMVFFPQPSGGGQVSFFTSSTAAEPARGTRLVRAYSVKQPATDGRRWVERLPGFMVAGAQAGFVGR